KKYFYVKNSWGAVSPYQGYVYMSEPYFRLKTVSIMVHKNAVPDRVKKGIGD
ncbi:MAG TPA: aminopeptidase, partial [Bacteroidetes bacterium]|nr:aminopeptidase [Bacteroidota bacterium]